MPINTRPEPRGPKGDKTLGPRKTEQQTGSLIAVQGGQAFLPRPLGKLIFDYPAKVVSLIADAEATLARLDSSVASFSRNPQLIARPFIKREAILTSRIEGTQTTYEGLVAYEADKQSDDRDAREVSSYIAALRYALERSKQIPIGERLILETHQYLMRETDTSKTTPGAIRRGQVVLGGTSVATARFVPPPEYHIKPLLEDLEAFITGRSHPDVPLLLRIAIAHYQFEAIHPFFDGNGRIGRLLIALMLVQSQKLSVPILDISAFLEPRRAEYYDLLLSISTDGGWQAWFVFFLEAIKNQAAEAAARIDALKKLRDNYYRSIESARNAMLLRKLVDELFASPLITIPLTKSLLNVSYMPAKEAVQKFVNSGILTEIASVGRARRFVARDILRLLETEISELDKPQPPTTPRVTASVHGVASGWASSSLERFRYLVATELAQEVPSRYVHGTWDVSYAVAGQQKHPTMSEFLQIMRLVKGRESGWPPWWVPTRQDLKPYPYDGAIECWMKETVFERTSHSDFWRVSPCGHLFLVRGYQEDEIPDRFAPGTALDPSLRIYRLTECILHSIRMAEALEPPNGSIEFRVHWGGLKGRKLVSVEDGFRDGLLEEHFCHQSDVGITTNFAVQDARTEVPAIVRILTKDLFEAFDFFKFGIKRLEAYVARIMQARVG